MGERGENLERLTGLVARLRAPDGCPWDRKQTMRDLKAYLIDEAYEVLKAIDSSDRRLLCEELGDLLFQIVFIARLAEEEGSFGIRQVVEFIEEKMIRRHPHVFGDSRVSTAQEVVDQWEAIKAAEGKSPATSALGGIPEDLPALYRAYRLGLKAAKVGFDWPGLRQVMLKVKEELGELEERISQGDAHGAARELGDLLFALANLARHLQRDPEGLLRQANQKFSRRFEKMEEVLRASGRSPREAGLEEMERIWGEIKASEDVLSGAVHPSIE